MNSFEPKQATPVDSARQASKAVTAGRSDLRPGAAFCVHPESSVWFFVGNGGMDPCSSPYTIPNNSPQYPFPHSLARTRESRESVSSFRHPLGLPHFSKQHLDLSVGARKEPSDIRSLGFSVLVSTSEVIRSQNKLGLEARKSTKNTRFTCYFRILDVPQQDTLDPFTCNELVPRFRPPATVCHGT